MPNPHSFRASDCHHFTAIRGGCNPETLASTTVEIQDRLLNGMEQVTFSVRFPSFDDGSAFATSVGSKNVPISNTLFDSCAALNPIASSNLAFHSNRAWEDSAYKVNRPPNRSSWRIVQGYTARASLTASGLAPTPGGLTAGFGPSVTFLLPPNGNNLPPRWVGGSVNVTRVRRSKGMGYTTGGDIRGTTRCKHDLPADILGIS